MEAADHPRSPLAAAFWDTPLCIPHFAQIAAEELVSPHNSDLAIRQRLDTEGSDNSPSTTRRIQPARRATKGINYSQRGQQSQAQKNEVVETLKDNLLKITTSPHASLTDRVKDISYQLGQLAAKLKSQKEEQKSCVFGPGSWSCHLCAEEALAKSSKIFQGWEKKKETVQPSISIAPEAEMSPDEFTFIKEITNGRGVPGEYKFQSKCGLGLGHFYSV